MNNIVIVTDRLYIRKLNFKDLKNFSLLENNELVRKYIPNLNKSTIYECRDILKKHINKYNYGNGLNTWALELRDTNEFLGITGFRYLEDLKEVEIGIRLLPTYWKMGYATEVGKALIRYGFSELSLKKIIAMALPENKNSIKSLENIGLDFDRYGYFRGSKVAFFKKTIYDNDVYKFYI